MSTTSCDRHLVGKAAAVHGIINIMTFSVILFCLLASCTTGLTMNPANKGKILTPNVNERRKTFLKHGTFARTAIVDPTAEPPSSQTSSLNLYGRYLNWIDTSPLVAKSITAAVVGCLGDVLSQWLEVKTRTPSAIFALNWVRFNAFFISGLFFVGPFLHCKLPVLLWNGWSEIYGSHRLPEISLVRSTLGTRSMVR